jgi:hypothetical protein
MSRHNAPPLPRLSSPAPLFGPPSEDSSVGAAAPTAGGVSSTVGSSPRPRRSSRPFGGSRGPRARRSEPTRESMRGPRSWQPRGAMRPGTEYRPSGSRSGSASFESRRFPPTRYPTLPPGSVASSMVGAAAGRVLSGQRASGGCTGSSWPSRSRAPGGVARGRWPRDRQTRRVSVVAEFAWGKGESRGGEGGALQGPWATCSLSLPAAPHPGYPTTSNANPRRRA